MTTAGCLTDLLRAEEAWIHHLPQKKGQLRAHMPPARERYLRGLRRCHGSAVCRASCSPASQAHQQTSKRGDFCPFSVGLSNSPLLLQKVPAQPCLQRGRRCRAWSLARLSQQQEQAGSVVTAAAPAVLKQGANRGWFKSPPTRCLML